MQLCFDKNYPERFHFEVKIMVCDKKSVRILQNLRFYKFCFIENT